MAATFFGTFDDLETERAFQLSERRAQLPYVRIYAAVAMIAMLAYALVNPLYFDTAMEWRFTTLLVPTVACLGGYMAATFWSRYPEQPMIDFAFLLAFAMLVTGINLLLFDELNAWHQTMQAAGGINRLIVTAFAAIALAGQMRWFLGWMLCHAVFFVAMMVMAGSSGPAMVFEMLGYVTGSAIMVFINWALGRAHRIRFLLSGALDRERARNEELLYNVLPPVAAQRLKEGMVVADSYSDASVVFIDVVGFSMLAKRVSPGHLIELLNAFFSLADRCAAETGVEKVKTIGDAYLAISGGNSPAANSADAAIAFAEAVIAGLSTIEANCGVAIQVRIGIHSGPVVGGVIGATRMAYDYWGETMNIASRIEGTASPNGIAISESTYMRTRDKRKFAEPSSLMLKGVGETQVYRLQPDHADIAPLAVAA